MARSEDIQDCELIRDKNLMQVNRGRKRLTDTLKERWRFKGRGKEAQLSPKQLNCY